MSDSTPALLLLCRDLMFTSKVTATARAHQVAVRVVRDPATLAPEGRTLMVDLGQDGTLAAATAWKQATAGTLIGFASHVDVGTIAQAKAAGFDEVLTRGAFTAKLEQIVGAIGNL